jgi:hypothetical protein
MDGMQFLVANRRRKMNFQVTPEEQEKIVKWLRETVYPSILEEQKKDPRIAAMHFEDEAGYTYPYFGAIGGDLTYSFTPTSIGTVLVVESCGHELNLTDYESW